MDTNYLNLFKSELAGDTDLLVAMIYGSAVSGRMHPESDIDVAVLYAHVLTVDERIMLMQRLQRLAGRPVDLIDLAVTNGVLLHQILTTGRVLLKNDLDSYFRLMQKAVYAQEDFIPYYRRTLRARAEEFANG